MSAPHESSPKPVITFESVDEFSFVATHSATVSELQPPQESQQEQESLRPQAELRRVGNLVINMARKTPG